MTSLNELFSVQTSAKPTAFDALIANSPVSDTDDLFVTIPGFDEGANQWGPCPFMPRGDVLPSRGDMALVVFSDSNVPWVVAWEAS